MYDEFQEMHRIFSEFSYDCLDPQDMVGLERANLQVLSFYQMPMRSAYDFLFPYTFPLALWSKWFYEGRPTPNYSLCQEKD